MDEGVKEGNVASRHGLGNINFPPLPPWLQRIEGWVR